jgi:long-chain acyl-CoA synthetase
MAAVEAERWTLKLSDEDVYLTFYPHFHVGVSWGITALRYGATLVIMERFDLNGFLKLAREYKATIVSGMPPVLYALITAPPGAEEYLRSVRRILTGGAPTPQEIWEKFVKRYPHIEVINAYGLSETIIVGTATAVPAGFSHLSKGYVSAGAPVAYCEVKIVDENDPSKELPPGQVGEIALRGPGVAKGYWKKPKETQESFLSDGWFLTGDVGYLDEEGILFVTGRKKDMIIMSGWKIYPAEVENVLLKHPKVAEAAIFPRYDEKRGEVPVAAVVLKPGEKATEEEIIKFCEERLAGYKVPRSVLFLDSLPKMGGWKVLHRVLREKYGGFPK